MSGNVPKALVVAGVLVWGLMTAGLARGADPRILEEDEVTAVKVMSVMKAAYLKCSIDEDGDVRIEEDGLITFITVDPERKLLKYFSFWHMKEEVSLEQKHDLVNRWNNDLIFVKFFVARPTTLGTEYWLKYADGILEHQLVTSYRQFQKVVIGAVQDNDPDNIIGE